MDACNIWSQMQSNAQKCHLGPLRQGLSLICYSPMRLDGSQWALGILSIFLSVGQTLLAQLTLFWENKVSEAPSQLSVTNHSTHIALGKDVALEYYTQVKLRSLHKKESIYAVNTTLFVCVCESRVSARHGSTHLWSWHSDGREYKHQEYKVSLLDIITG